MVFRVLRETSFFSSRTMIGLLFALSIVEIVDASYSDGAEFCPDQASVDLIYAKRNDTGFLTESGHFFPADVVRNTNGALRGCICDVKPCLPLCVPLKNANGLDYSGNVSAELPAVYTTHLTLETVEGSPLEATKWFHVFFQNPCKDRPAYYLEPDVYESDEWYLVKNGSLVLPRRNGTAVFLDLGRYCLRQLLNHTTYTPRVCSPVPRPDPFRTASYIGGLVSVPFIILTIIVYSVLPELRNIHGNVFRCYLCCLLASYVTLAVDRIPPPESNVGTACLVLGFLIYFFFITTFLWLNVMCFDMCRKFGGFRTYRSSGKKYERKKFIEYSIYAWGIGILMTAICIGFEFSPSLSESVISPGFRKRSCWFSTKAAAALFFFGPVGVTIFCNVCFFVLTSVKLFQHKRNAQRQESCGDSERQDENKLLFSLYFKLFIIMGISWSTEVVSGLWESPRYVWYFTDMLNALQGILIFIIFVCKKKIWRSLQTRSKCFPRFNKNGCTFTQRSTDSKSTTTSLDDCVPQPENSIALNARANASPANQLP